MKKAKVRYSLEDKIINAEVYSAFLEAKLDDGWGQKDKKENFELLTKIAEFSNTMMKDKSVLDVGCGTGDFAPFLRKKGVSEYLGIDIFEPAVYEAEEKYPNEKFITGDFLETDFKKFNFVFSSGSLTTKLNTNNYEVLKAWIKKMWEVSNIGVAFNLLLEEYPGQKTTGLFVYDRRKVLEICALSLPEAQMKTVITPAGSEDHTEEMHVFLFR
ncbi:MAG: Methyltransferase type 12 [Candidatus Daviesbacteria bacterium GW2011_GWA2_38_24]|uniref:Methyltransferase type 12 n=1 Tax=Candidatus Daviesbacteria bacterium GW2011_GWA2_38_24 TaxID=1618422 RepID=A0A0G0JS62_9BACT|nr:MAG: Methyltransferase type 12 [Candidatus Daviesbacteria bacterium GW2011_GWA2_38_24]KKQ80850.1 MAG: Methyltransferase type 12 [Candidatus Daviesbacteria bacterium GW2011_GWA1_38_7]